MPNIHFFNPIGNDNHDFFIPTEEDIIKVLKEIEPNWNLFKVEFLLPKVMHYFNYRVSKKVIRTHLNKITEGVR